MVKIIKKYSIDIFLVVFLIIIGWLSVPCLSSKFGEGSVKEASKLAGLSLASFYVIWRWKNLRKTTKVLSSFVIIFGVIYAGIVYVIGTFRLSWISIGGIIFIVIHSVFMSITSIIVSFLGFCAEDAKKQDRNDLIRILTSALMLISLMSIAVTLLLSGKITELPSMHQRAILMCGYGFLAVATYSLGYICAVLKIAKVNALCLLLSGLFGFFFGMIISLTSPFNVYMFSFSVQVILIMGLFITHNYIDRILTIFVKLD